MSAPPLALATWGWILLSVAALAAVWALFVAALYVGGRGPAARALARLIPDLLVLFKRLLGDARVPRRAKVVLALCLGYLALPIDLVPDFIPVAGVFDDAVIVAFVLRYALGSTGPALISELWPGPPQSLAVVLRFAGDPGRAAANLVWIMLAGVALPLIAFVVLAEHVWEREVIDWDSPLLRYLDTHQGASLTQVMKIVTTLGGSSVVVLLILAALLLPLLARLRREALFLFLVPAGAGALNVLLKGVFQRPRPDLFPHLVAVDSSSFPSGHTMSAAALAAALIVLAWRTPWRWPVVAAGTIYAVGVGLSRVYLGVHFPSDVIAGWALVIAWTTVIWLAVFWWPEASGACEP